MKGWGIIYTRAIGVDKAVKKHYICSCAFVIEFVATVEGSSRQQNRQIISIVITKQLICTRLSALSTQICIFMS